MDIKHLMKMNVEVLIVKGKYENENKYSRSLTAASVPPKVVCGGDREDNVLMQKSNLST